MAVVIAEYDTVPLYLTRMLPPLRLAVAVLTTRLLSWAKLTFTALAAAPAVSATTRTVALPVFVPPVKAPVTPSSALARSEAPLETLALKSPDASIAVLTWLYVIVLSLYLTVSVPAATVAVAVA